MCNARRQVSSWAAAAGVLAAALCVLPLQAQGMAPEEPPARGLIVRLKQPVAHPGERSREAPQESARWRRVIGEAGLSGASGRREPRLRPVGRDQQLLEFDAPLSRSECSTRRMRRVSVKARNRPGTDMTPTKIRIGVSPRPIIEPTAQAKATMAPSISETISRVAPIAEMTASVLV